MYPGARSRGMSRYRAIGYDTDTSAWAVAVTAAGGTYSARTLAAVSAFSRSAKAAGYWTKLTRINLFCGNQLAAALVPLKVGGGNATDTNFNFVGGDYSEATGLTGDQTTKYLKTGLLANTLTLNNTHLAVYNRAIVPSAGVPVHIGADDSTNRLQISAPFISEIVYSDQYNVGTGRVNTAGAIAAPYGFLVGSRTAAGAHAIYRNGGAAASNATSGGSLPALEFYVGASNVSGTPTGFIRDPLSAYSIGFGLTAAEAAAYDTHMQIFQTALGRNV